MDIVNTTFNQIGDLFKSMTPGARLLAALLAGAIVLSLAFLVTQPFDGGDDYLLGGVGFSGNELPAMEAAFGKANLSTYTLDGNRIRIPHGQQARYMAALADAGALPSHFGDHLAKATASSSPFDTRPVMDERLKGAKQQELALIIRSMQGIETAAVLYDSQRRGGLRPATTTTASVSVKASGGRSIEGQQVTMIRHLVAGAIAGLSPKDVTVADLNTGRVHADTSGPDSPGSATDDPYISRKREYEALMAEKVYAALSYVPGVTVSVNADLSRELRRHEENDTVDPKQSTPITQREETTSSNQSMPAPGGRPGLAGQQAANQPAMLTQQQQGSESTEERSLTETNYGVSNKRTMTDFAVMTPERVTVAIGVPGKYVRDVWQQQNPTPSGQQPKEPDRAALTTIELAEVERIRKHVEPLIPKSLTPDTETPAVTVTTFSPVPINTEIGISTTALAFDWFSNHWSTVALLGLALMSLRMLRSFVTSAASHVADAASPAPGSLLSATVGGEESEAPAATVDKKPGRLKRRENSGLSLRDELVEMVKEDPDSAANILRGWIGNAT